MEYGYFDDKAREYVITNPATPAPWANYLGSVNYGGLISNNAGGYSFAKSGADGRIIRYVFNQQDKPGRYVYLRDDDTADYWSASWQPVGKDLNDYRSICRHGMGYTKMYAAYSGIHSEVLYYVPLDAEYEVWAVSVENHSKRPRNLTVSGVCEFTNENNYEQDQVNLQYSLFITRTIYEKNKIRQQVNGNLDVSGEAGEKSDGNRFVERFIGLAGAEVSSFCGDRDEFLGPYRYYNNPIGIENGDLGGALNYGGNSVGALSTKLTLDPGERKTLCFIVGMQDNQRSTEILRHYEIHTRDIVTDELKTLKNWWYEKFSHFEVHTPSKEFDTMVNTWNAYNCFMTFLWSRAASFIYCGQRNGYGFRDTVQDIQGIIHLAPDMAREKIEFMLSGQVDNGGGLPLVKFTHDPGHEMTPDDPDYEGTYRADDALWLFPTIYKYIAETGDLAFLDKEIPYCNNGSDIVYDHLKKAIGFSLDHLGPHGLPAGLWADWNDCLRLGANGESSFVAFQFYYALVLMKSFAWARSDDDYVGTLNSLIDEYGQKIQDLCWDEDRFIRGYTEDGTKIGQPGDPEAAIWLNPQSWSVISTLATKEQEKKSFELVNTQLNTAYGAVLMDPPYHEHAFDGALAVIFNAGMKENGGIFSQSQGWLILAEALMGNGNDAFMYFMENAPAAQNRKAEIRRIEPYVYGQFTEGKYSPNLGRSHVHWLTGTASTVMVGCVEGICGMRPDLNGIHISPSIPSAWDSFSIEKDFRGCHLSISVANPQHRQSGVSRLLLNGEEIDGDYIPAERLKESNEIEVIL